MALAKKLFLWHCAVLWTPNSFEDTIRLAVLCDGDTDTKACIAGAVAEAYYEIPEKMEEKAFSYLPDDMLEVLSQFYDRIQLDINK